METEQEQHPIETTITPKTRRVIIWSLFLIALACIAAEVVLAILGQERSDALLTLAATAIGGLAGSLLPGSDPF